MRKASYPLPLFLCMTLSLLLSTATTPALATESSSSLTGHWQSAETEDEKSQRLQAIDNAIRRMGALQQRMARGRLSERTTPPQSLLLQIETPKVMIASEDRRIELELGAPPIKVSGDQGKARVSAKMEGPKLIVVALNPRGERITAYRTDGDHLWVEVTMSGPHLAAPLKYVSTFSRLTPAHPED